MLARTLGYGLSGVSGFAVKVEVYAATGMPALEIIGLPDASVKESRDRVSAAIVNSGFTMPISRLTVNLAPADQRKEGPAFDLPIAISILMASGQLEGMDLTQTLMLGELSLDGSLHPVRGALPIGRDAGIRLAAVRPQRVLELLDRCVDQVLMGHPTARLVLRRRMFTWGQIPRMRQLKELLLESVRRHPELTDRQRGNLLGECDLIESFLYYNDIGAMSRFHRSASRQMTRRAVSIQGHGSWTFGSASVLMMFHRTPGQLDRELADMDECMPHYYKITGGHGMGAQRIMEGEAALARGRLNDGAIALERARAAISGSGQENMALCCDFLEMRLHMAAGEAVGVDLRRRRQLLQQHNAMWLHIFASTAASCQAVLGRADDIPELFREHRLDTVNFLGPCLPMMQMIENQVYLAQGAYARVIGGSEGLLALCRGMHYALVELYVLVQTAAAYEKLGKRREAAELLRQAAALAQPDGLVTPLAANGRYLRALLPEYGTLGREAAELSRVLEQGTQQEQRPEALAPLTEREWAVAQRMARRLSNREIAGQLFLTEGTVKQYINQIYSKLHLAGDVRTKRGRLEELMGE